MSVHWHVVMRCIWVWITLNYLFPWKQINKSHRNRVDGWTGQLCSCLRGLHIKHTSGCWHTNVLLHGLPDFSSPVVDTDVPCWRLSLWATLTASATHCHRRRCKPTRPTSRWAYSRGGMGWGRPQPCSLKSNSSTVKDKINNIHLCVLHQTFVHTTQPQELIIWLINVLFIFCAGTGSRFGNSSGRSLSW